MKGPDIHVRGLGLRLGGASILEELDFSVTSGALHCLIGPNGGGKTSALRCLLGQMPHSGDIRIDWYGERRIGYVPQLLELERSLPLSVQDFLVLAFDRRPAFARPRADTATLVEEALARVGLEGKRRSLLGGLSGGERQRLLFAQALVPDPALLVLDEPMTGLDEGGGRLFERLILEANAAGATVLWVNHDLRQVRRLAHSLTCIDRRVLAHGPVAEVLTPAMEAGDFHEVAATQAREAG